MIKRWIDGKELVKYTLHTMSLGSSDFRNSSSECQTFFYKLFNLVAVKPIQYLFHIEVLFYH